MKHHSEDSFGLWLMVFFGLAMLVLTLAASVGAFSLQLWQIF